MINTYNTHTNLSTNNPPTNQPATTTNDHKNKINIVHWNACGISTKITEFELFLLNQRIDICVVTETKWGKKSSVVFNAIDSHFNVIHKFRKSNGGAGGISMFIRKNLNFLEINEYIDQKIECICVKIFSKARDH